MIKNILNDYKIKRVGSIHIGAHIAEELAEYEDMGILNLLYIEANPRVIEELKNKVITNYEGNLNIELYNLAVSNCKRSKQMYLTEAMMCSSLFELSEEYKSRPDGRWPHSIQEVKCEPLDFFIKIRQIDMSKYNILVMDTQGSELEILEKATKTLKDIDLIKAEVFYKPIYKDIITHKKVKKLLKNRGYVLVYEDMATNKLSSDCYFIKKEYKKCQQQ